LAAHRQTSATPPANQAMRQSDARLHHPPIHPIRVPFELWSKAWFRRVPIASGRYQRICSRFHFLPRYAKALVCVYFSFYAYFIGSERLSDGSLVAGDTAKLNHKLNISRFILRFVFFSLCAFDSKKRSGVFSLKKAQWG
jgi:hypothetical protein